MIVINDERRPKAFVDTLFWVGRLIPSDAWHTAFVMAEKALPQNALFVTTESILTEFLSSVSIYGPVVRRKAATLFADALTNKDFFRVIGWDEGTISHRDLLSRGLELYAKRDGKEYSLVDCISFVAMKSEGIYNALTNDHHFTQEGFNRLIK